MKSLLGNPCELFPQAKGIFLTIIIIIIIIIGIAIIINVVTTFSIFNFLR